MAAAKIVGWLLLALLVAAPWLGMGA